METGFVHTITPHVFFVGILHLNLPTDCLIHKVIMAPDDNPTVLLPFPRHRVTPDHPLAPLIVLFDGKYEILDDGDIVMDLNINGPELAYGNLGRFGPEPHPFIQPRPVNIDRALVPNPDEIRRDILQKILPPPADQMLPMFF